MYSTKIKTILKNIIIFLFCFMMSYGENAIKVISLSPAVTETLFHFGVGSSVVGRTDFCITPKEVSKIESMGSMFTPNIEKIVYVKSDYVILQSHYDSRMNKQLEKMGVKTILLDTPKSIEDILRQYDIMLAIFPDQTSIQKELRRVKESVRLARERSSKMEKHPKIYYSLGSGHIEYTAGKDSFIDDLITVAGGENIVQEIGWSYPLEALIEKQPDFLIISRSKYEQMIRSSKYEQLKVLKDKKRVILVEEDEITLATPRLLTETLNKIQETILNSDFFN